MVEVLGIMAIAALLALAIVPMMLSELDRLALQQEETSLKRIAEGIEKYVVRNQILPTSPPGGGGVGGDRRRDGPGAHQFTGPTARAGD